VQQRLISEIFTLVANRPNSACNFLPYGNLPLYYL
jgi:AP-3 complex subunit sigma